MMHIVYYMVYIWVAHLNELAAPQSSHWGQWIV